MKKKIVSLVIIAVLSLALLAACGPDPQTAIIGTWECRDTSVSHEWICEFTFTNDGRFRDRDGDTGDYRINNNTLTLDFDMDGFGPFDLTMRFSGNTLRLSGDGLNVRLNRR